MDLLSYIASLPVPQNHPVLQTKLADSQCSAQIIQGVASRASRFPLPPGTSLDLHWRSPLATHGWATTNFRSFSMDVDSFIEHIEHIELN